MNRKGTDVNGDWVIKPVGVNSIWVAGHLHCISRWHPNKQQTVRIQHLPLPTVKTISNVKCSQL